MQESQEKLQQIDQALTSLIKRSQEDCEDCDEVLSSCCQSEVDIIPGSLPLQVKCIKCSKLFLLRDLLTS